VRHEHDTLPGLGSSLPTTCEPKWARQLGSAEIRLDATVPLGQYWGLEGGFYAGLLQGWPGQPCYRLIVALHFGSTMRLVDTDQTPFGSHEARSFRDGLSNSVSWLKRDSPAALWTLNLAMQGHQDWYVPSMAELFLLAANLADRLAPGIYWSSTRADQDRVWGLDLSNGLQVRTHAMSAEAQVLPVRRA